VNVAKEMAIIAGVIGLQSKAVRISLKGQDFGKGNSGTVRCSKETESLSGKDKVSLPL
jgi:hypothetical protein